MSADIVTANCVQHGHGMVGCTVMVNGVIVAFTDGPMPTNKTLAEVEAEIVANRRRTMAAPEILAPDYARRIHERRIEQRISLRDVAQRLRLTTAEVSNMERGITSPHSYRLAILWAMVSGIEHDEAVSLFQLQKAEATP